MKGIFHLLFGVTPTRPARRRGPRRTAVPTSATAHTAPPRKARKPGGKPAPPRQGQAAPGGTGTLVFHGTPSLEAARSIRRHGWIVGTGNALGDGIYTTTSITTAKSYAGAGGYLIKARLQPGRCATWSAPLAQAFQTWCTQRKCPSDPPARTAFLLERGFTTLRDGAVFVVLHRGYRNPTATKVRPPCLRVLEVIAAATGRPVQV